MYLVCQLCVCTCIHVCFGEHVYRLSFCVTLSFDKIDNNNNNNNNNNNKKKKKWSGYARLARLRVSMADLPLSAETRVEVVCTGI